MYVSERERERDTHAQYAIPVLSSAGVIMSNGKRWENARRFLLRNLRDLGMGKTYLEESILVEARALVEDFRSGAGTPAHLPESLNVAVLNIIWQMVASTSQQ